MDYNELALLVKKKNYTIASFAVAMGMTRQGFHSGIVNQSFTQEKICRICQLLDITPNEFMGWPQESLSGSGNYAAHISGHNTQNSNEAIKALKDQLKEKDKQIDRLLRIVEKK